MLSAMTRQTSSFGAVLLAVAAVHRVSAVALAGQTSHTLSFDSFVKLYDRAYVGGSAEYEERRALYDQRVAEVLHHNSKPERRWTAGINSLADRTHAELKSLRGWKRTGPVEEQLALAQVDEKSEPLPKQVSWSFLNSSKKQWEQGACGSCWAIATVELLEMHNEIYPVPKRTFSAQDLVSCVQNPHHCGGQGKCDGATIELALDHAFKHGVAEEHDVPYTATDGTCKKPKPGFLQSRERPRRRLRSSAATKDKDDSGLLSWNRHQFGMTGFRKLPSNQYLPLMRALLNGPVGVSVAASDWSMYNSGVFECTGKDAIIDHAVVLLGYGQEDLGKYWLLKNSWGEDWGINGMIKLLRLDKADEDEGSWCGVDNKPELGSGCDGGPSEVEVCGQCGILYDTVMPQFTGHVSGELRQQALEMEMVEESESSGSLLW